MTSYGINKLLYVQLLRLKCWSKILLQYTQSNVHMLTFTFVVVLHFDTSNLISILSKDPFVFSYHLVKENYIVRMMAEM